MWFRKVVAVLLLIAATVLLGRYVADRWASQEGRFLTAEEFFGEELLRQIEELGIPVATHTALMQEMYDGLSGRRAEEMVGDVTYDMCTLPAELTLHFQYREFVPDTIPSLQPRDSSVDLAAVHALDEPCSNDLVLSMVEIAAPDDFRPIGPDRTLDISFEIEADGFPFDRSWRSRYYIVLRRNVSGELLTARVREEWNVITPWGRAIQQLEQNPYPSRGQRWLGSFSFPLQLGVAY